VHGWQTIHFALLASLQAGTEYRLRAHFLALALLFPVCQNARPDVAFAVASVRGGILFDQHAGVHIRGPFAESSLRG